MKQMHTPEPWFCDGDAIYNNVHCAGDPIAHVLTMPFDDAGNACDARRIVACVNACAGMPTWKLERDGLPSVREYLDMESQRDQLLAALEGLIDLYENPASFSGKTGEQRMLMLENQAAKSHAAIHQARQAIAAVKGEIGDNTL